MQDPNETRACILALLQQAQTLISQAAELACPVPGWAREWAAIDKHYEATKTLWHRIDRAPSPRR